jgi:hypothetical protein
MKLNVLVLALAATAFGSLAANAQTTIIEERRDPAVVIEQDRPATSVTIEKRNPAVRIEKRETTGLGDCSTKTIHKESLEGSKTIKKTNCD